MLPTERRSVREQRVRNRLAAAAVIRSQRRKALGNVLLIIGGKARPTAFAYVRPVARQQHLPELHRSTNSDFFPLILHCCTAI